jgi:hypothetical protein
MNAPNQTVNLNGTPVLLSASMTDEVAAGPRARELYTAIGLFVHEVIAAGGRIVFGGHPGITPLVREAVSKLGKENVVDLYQLRRFEGSAPAEIRDDRVFGRIHWIESAADDIDAELGQMRDQMAEAARAAVFLGGKAADHYGKTPGIRDEYQRFMEKRPDGPVYLVGLLGGETLNLIRELEAGAQPARNGLSEEERRVIHHSTSIDLIVSLIIEDLARKAAENGKQA